MEDTYNNMGIVFKELGDYEKAFSLPHWTLRLNPSAELMWAWPTRNQHRNGSRKARKIRRSSETVSRSIRKNDSGGRSVVCEQCQHSCEHWTRVPKPSRLRKGAFWVQLGAPCPLISPWPFACVCCRHQTEHWNCSWKKRRPGAGDAVLPRSLCHIPQISWRRPPHD